MSKLAMRRAWFQVHKWLGLALAILIVPIALSGAALVWDEALARVVTPQRFAVSGKAHRAPDAYVAATLRVFGRGERPAMLTMPDDGPVVLSGSPAIAQKRPGPPERTMVYLDPPTARVLDVASSSSGVLRTLHMLHGSLLVPGVGRTIVGWIGVAMMLSAFTGLWLWWPTVGRWARGLRWKRHRNTDTNLHYLFGFWIALPLFVLSLTGAWISFPAFFAGLSGSTPQQRGPDRATMARARTLANPAQPLDRVLARAGAIGRGEVRSISWPTDLKPEWTIGYAAGTAPIRYVTVADADSNARAVADARGGEPVARLMRRIHNGTGMGTIWQVIIFVGGILPAVLAVTGVVMWLRARRWRADLAARQRVRGQAAAAK